jgi:mannose-1-phosphate guanylyltransferase
MILGAGFGTRLRPLTESVPKPLLSVGGRPIIEYALLYLRAGGIRDIVINLHHLADQIQDRLGDGSAYGVRIAYSVERDILDTGGGIKNAEHLLAGEPFVVANGDTVMDPPLAELIDQHRSEGALATMLLRSDPEAARYGLVHVDERCHVRAILGRPPVPADAGWSTYMFAGLHVFDPRIFQTMPAGRPFSITRETYPEQLEAGERILGIATDRTWLTIDTPEALAAADAAVASGRISLPYVTS